MVKYPERELMVVPECNDENDNPTCWAMSCGYSWNRDGSKHEHFIWICKYADNEYIVENADGANLADNDKIYKTLWGAKRCADGIAWRRDESGSWDD